MRLYNALIFTAGQCFAGPAINQRLECIVIQYSLILGLEGSVMFGVTTVDLDGNESDMTTLSKPLQLHLPKAPAAISITSSEYFKELSSDEAASEQYDNNAQIEDFDTLGSKEEVDENYDDDVQIDVFNTLFSEEAGGEHHDNDAQIIEAIETDENEQPTRVKLL